MIWIVLGIGLILLGLVGIYFLLFKFDRKKLDFTYMDSPSFDGIISILLFFFVIILISLFHEKKMSASFYFIKIDFLKRANLMPFRQLPRLFTLKKGNYKLIILIYLKNKIKKK